MGKDEPPSQEELRLMLCSLARQLFEANRRASYWRAKARAIAWNQPGRVYLTDKGREAPQQLEQTE